MKPILRSKVSENICIEQLIKEGNTVDFLLTKRRQRISAQRFLIKAIDNNVEPEIINIDKSGANTAAIKLYNRKNYSNIKIRQCKYLKIL